MRQVACCVLGAIALLGLFVACSRPSCVRSACVTLYFGASLPVWVSLGFAAAFCFVFRAEAEGLVSYVHRTAPLQPNHRP